MQDGLISFSVFKLELLKPSLFSFKEVYSTSTDFSFIKGWLRNLCIKISVLPIEKTIKRKENIPHLPTKWEFIDVSPVDSCNRHQHENCLVCDEQTGAGSRNRDAEHSSQVLPKGAALKPPNVCYRLTVMPSVPLEMEITQILRSALPCESSLCSARNQGCFCSFSLLFPPVRNHSRLGTDCLLSLLVQT